MIDLEQVRKLLFRSAVVADNIGLVDRTSSSVRQVRPSLSKDIHVAEGIPATEGIPAAEEILAGENISATEDNPAAENTAATEDAPAAEDIPATQDDPATEHIVADQELPATEDIPAALNAPLPPRKSGRFPFRLISSVVLHHAILF